jgi:excisionase family DNA binding protein
MPNANEKTNQLLLKADEVAHQLSLGRATVYLLMQSGELPTVRIGRSVRVPAAGLSQWIEQQQTGGAL